MFLLEKKLVFCTPVKSAKVCIDIFILEYPIGTHRISGNFNIGISNQKPREKSCDPNTEFPKELGYRCFGSGRNKVEYEFELDSKMVACLILTNIIYI